MCRSSAQGGKTAVDKMLAGDDDATPGHRENNEEEEDGKARGGQDTVLAEPTSPSTGFKSRFRQCAGATHHRPW